MIGRLLDGRYKILQVLGSEGFSEMYLAQDTRRPGSPTCVVKVLKPDTKDPNFLQISQRLFQSEAETLERMGSNSPTPRLLAYFEENQECYLIQECTEGHLPSAESAPENLHTEPQVLFAEDPSQLQPQPMPLLPQVVPTLPLPPLIEKPVDKIPVLVVGAGVLAALIVGTVGFFALKPQDQTPPPLPNEAPAESVRSPLVETQNNSIGVASSTTEPMSAQNPAVVDAGAPISSSALQPPLDPLVTTAKKPIAASPEAVATLKSRRRKRQRKKTVVATRTSARSPAHRRRTSKTKKTATALQAARRQKSEFPIAPVSNTPPNGLRSAATPVR